MSTPIRRADLVKGGDVVKQGDIFTLGFQLFGDDNKIIVPTTEMITAKIANKVGVVYETIGRVVENRVEFDITQDLGSGVMRIEFKVSEGDTVMQKYPSEGFIPLRVTPSLDDAGVGGIIAISATQMRAEITAINTQAEQAVLDAADAKEVAEYAQTQVDTVLGASTIDPAVAQMKVGTGGIVYASPDARLRAENTSITTQLAEKAKQTDLITTNNTVAFKADKTEVNTLASGKADKTYVDSNLSNLDTKINSQASGSPKGTFATLVALQTAFPTGNANIYVVTADGKWYYWNGTVWTPGGVFQSTGISEKSISGTRIVEDTIRPSHIRRMKESVNLLNPKTIVNNQYVDATGVLKTTSVYSASDYISVDANAQYTVSHAVDAAKMVTYFDKNKTFLSTFTVVGGGANYTFITHANVEYMRINIYNANKVNFMVVRGNTIPVEFVPFSLMIDGLSLDGGTVNYLNLDAHLKNSIDSIESLSLEDLEGATVTVNLLNATKLKTGYIVASSVGETANADFSVSDYIEVKPSTQYTVSRAYTIIASFFDANKVYLSNSGSVADTVNYTLTPPVNARFIRVNIRNLYLNNFMVVEGATIPTEFVPFGVTINSLLLNDESVNYASLDAFLKGKIDSAGTTTKWTGKTFFTFGDSITWYDGQPFGTMHSDYGVNAKGYQSYMREKLGCTVANKGVSGNRMPQILTTIKAQNYTGVSAVTITAGANDFRVTEATEPFGTVQPIGSTFDETSFTGSFQAAIEYVLGINPEMKIYLITPIKGWSASGSNEMPNTYPNAMKQIAGMYSLSVCDWYGTSGINTLNKTTYIGDDASLGYYLHPTNIGYERMANILIPFLENN